MWTACLGFGLLINTLQIQTLVLPSFNGERRNESRKQLFGNTEYMKHSSSAFRGAHPYLYCWRRNAKRGANGIKNIVPVVVKPVVYLSDLSSTKAFNEQLLTTYENSLTNQDITLTPTEAACNDPLTTVAFQEVKPTFPVNELMVLMSDAILALIHQRDRNVSLPLGVRKTELVQTDAQSIFNESKEATETGINLESRLNVPINLRPENVHLEQVSGDDSRRKLFISYEDSGVPIYSFVVLPKIVKGSDNFTAFNYFVGEESIINGLTTVSGLIPTPSDDRPPLHASRSDKSSVNTKTVCNTSAEHTCTNVTRKASTFCQAIVRFCSKFKKQEITTSVESTKTGTTTMSYSSPTSTDVYEALDVYNRYTQNITTQPPSTGFIPFIKNIGKKVSNRVKMFFMKSKHDYLQSDALLKFLSEKLEEEGDRIRDTISGNYSIEELVLKLEQMKSTINKMYNHTDSSKRPESSSTPGELERNTHNK